MRVSDIKIGCIYNVVFDPVQEGEFNGKHLAIVLKKNNDNRTFIVIPLTSSAKGEGINKVKIGKIDTLPMSLKFSDSYAVYNQIRTINASRFIALKEGKNIIESKVKDEVFDELLCLGVKELLYHLDIDRKLRILKKVYETECLEKAREFAYNIIKMRKQQNEDKVLIA